MIRKIKRHIRNLKSKNLVNRIMWFEGAMVDQGRDYYPFGLADYCSYQPDLIKDELIRLRDCRKSLINELKKHDYTLYKKLYPNEEIREKELDDIIEQSYQNAIEAEKVFAEYAKTRNEEKNIEAENQETSQILEEKEDSTEEYRISFKDDIKSLIRFQKNVLEDPSYYLKYHVTKKDGMEIHKIYKRITDRGLTLGNEEDEDVKAFWKAIEKARRHNPLGGMIHYN